MTRPRSVRRRSVRDRRRRSVRCSQRSLPSNRAANGERPCTATLLSITSRSPGSSTTATSGIVRCVSRTASTTRFASGSMPIVRSASNTNVGESVVPVTRAMVGPSSLVRSPRKLASTAVRNRGSNIASTVAVGARRTGRARWPSSSRLPGRHGDRAAAGSAGGTGGTPSRCGTSASTATTWRSGGRRRGAVGTMFCTMRPPCSGT